MVVNEYKWKRRITLSGNGSGKLRIVMEERVGEIWNVKEIVETNSPIGNGIWKTLNRWNRPAVFHNGDYHGYWGKTAFIEVLVRTLL